MSLFDNPKLTSRGQKPLRRWSRGLNNETAKHWRTLRESRYRDQGGKCEICGRAITLGVVKGQKEAAHLDHDHVTGKIRGVLCVLCNLGLGSFDDNQALMLKAIRYLSKWAKQP